MLLQSLNLLIPPFEEMGKNTLTEASEPLKRRRAAPGRARGKRANQPEAGATDPDVLAPRPCPTCGSPFTPQRAYHWECRPCWVKRQNTTARLQALEAAHAVLERDNARLTQRCAALEQTVRRLHAQLSQANPAATSGPALPEDFPTMLGRLIQLCHPDRHGGSKAAQRATQWLLALRQRQRAERGER